MENYRGNHSIMTHSECLATEVWVAIHRLRNSELMCWNLDCKWWDACVWNSGIAQRTFTGCIVGFRQLCYCDRYCDIRCV